MKKTNLGILFSLAATANCMSSSNVEENEKLSDSVGVCEVETFIASSPTQNPNKRLDNILNEMGKQSVHVVEAYTFDINKPYDIKSSTEYIAGKNEIVDTCEVTSGDGRRDVKFYPCHLRADGEIDLETPPTFLKVTTRMEDLDGTTDEFNHDQNQIYAATPDLSKKGKSGSVVREFSDEDLDGDFDQIVKYVLVDQGQGHPMSPSASREPLLDSNEGSVLLLILNGLVNFYPYEIAFFSGATDENNDGEPDRAIVANVWLDESSHIDYMFPDTSHCISTSYLKVTEYDLDNDGYFSGYGTRYSFRFNAKDESDQCNEVEQKVFCPYYDLFMFGHQED